MSNDVFLKFDYGLRDVVNGIRLRIRSSLRSTALAVGALACLAGLVVLIRWAPPWVRVASAWLLVIAALQSAFTALRLVPHVMFRKSVQDAGLTRDVRGDFWSRNMSVDASEEGITVTVGRRSATIKRRDCVGFESDARTYLIRHGATGYLVVPRRAFRTERKDAAFRELASRLVQTREEAPVPGPLPASLQAALPRREVPSPTAPLPVTSSPPAKVGRNDPCPCGSGKKHKKCCLGAERSEGPGAGSVRSR